MNKGELEGILVEPSGAEALLQRARTMISHLETGDVSEPLALYRAGGVQAGQLTPTEIQRNDRRFFEQSLLPGGLSRFIDDVKGKSSIEALEVLLRQHLSHPTLQSAILLEDATNRLTTAGDLDASAQTIVNQVLDATKDQRTPRRRGKRSKDDFENDDIWFTAYEHADFKGKALTSDLWAGEIYKKVRGLGAVGLNDAISSLRIGASSNEVGGKVILFEHDRFIGRYASWDATPGGTVDVNYVGNFINDLTSSILIVRRSPHDLGPLQLGSQITPDDIKKFVQSRKKISPRGDPVLTWDMWPEGPTSGDDPHPNEPSKTYVYVKVPITVHVPYWFDYDAEIRYWIYLYVADDGTLNGFTDYFGAWVEGGIIHDSVLSGLMAEIPTTLGDVQTFLAKALTLANVFGPFQFMHYLPGMNQSTGRTTDDLTIVLAGRVPLATRNHTTQIIPVDLTALTR